MGKKTIFILLYLLIVNTSYISSEKKANKYVTTLINAKWQETPLVLEVAEYLNDENSNYFWNFVDDVSKRSDEFLSCGSVKDHYELVLKIVKNILSPSEIAMLKLSLSLRIYSARVEMFAQMSLNKASPEIDCDNFLDIGGHVTCDFNELDKIDSKAKWENIDTYSVDHFYIDKQNTNKTIVLYGQLGSVGFNRIHEKLKNIALNQKINYILRHYVKERVDKKLRLSGYGVELQMKSTEYKATDDSDIKEKTPGSNEGDDDENMNEIEGINFAVLSKLYPDKRDDLDKLQTHLLETSHEIGALKVWQFQDLSHQAAERILSSPKEEALQVLIDIAQNFPMQAKSLIKTKVRSEIKTEMKANQEIFLSRLNIQPTDTAIFVNGLYFDLDTIDVLTLLESLRSELRVMESLHKIGFANKVIDKLIALDLSGNMDSTDFAIDIRDSAIVWVNDIENDSRYSKWMPSYSELLLPTFPGMLRHIRRNLYNLILMIDPLDKKSVPLLTLAKSLYEHSTPLRIGFVYVVNSDKLATGLTDPSVAINNAYHYFVEKKGSREALNFLAKLSNFVDFDSVEISDIKKAIKSRDSDADVDYILGEESEYDIGRLLGSDFIKRTGFKSFPQALLNGMPLASNQLNEQSFEEAVLTAIMQQTPAIQKAVYRGTLTDRDDIVDYLMNQPNVMPRLNERILKVDKNKWLNLVGSAQTENQVESLNSQDKSNWLMQQMKYVYVQDNQHVYSIWIVVDLHQEAGRTLLREALSYLAMNSIARITLIINDDEKVDSKINTLALTALNNMPRDKAVIYLNNLLKESNAKLIEEGNFEVEEELKNHLEDTKSLIKAHRHYARTVLNMEKGTRAVVCNGRVIGPLNDDEDFLSDDFELLQRFSESTYGDKLFKALVKKQLFNDDDYESAEVNDDMMMKIAALLVPRPQSRMRFEIKYSGDEHSAIKIPPSNPDDVAFNLVAIVDPVSRGAQKLGPILKVLQESLNCEIRVFLNCLDKNSDMPLKSFYRFVMEPELQFNNEGEIMGAMAKFNRLPTSSLLTQNMHTPENWLVEVVKSVYDLDNIKLDNVAMGVHSEYELEHLLLEGHCFEAMVGNPPRGLQITLGTNKNPVMVDTIVMANLGYFQLKANPGEWLLRLRQGRSAEIYDISSIDGQDVIQHDNDVKVLVSSLRSHVLKMRVAKKPGKQKMDLLADEEDSPGLWDSLSRTFAAGDDSVDKDETINIFSLASGHLYERFLKIMMLSVIKHTKSPVKFWFLKNYLSPTLKDFLPHMAKDYGFEYELVQYKWPRWLNQQTEKQRIIWGYKILFLDVLFPLDVKKIIFVDADQVVRADLKELVTMDLGGAPYAYTPFCDSRKEMDGFRFWRQGYWRNHLQGRSYHISALYVVDLKRFRRIAAGDRLRGQYQALSQDPNSLSNLDQDLPNNMIHQVAIKTLPQEWLWCETWCDDASKKYAKTIDLCNNPMTKEAKLKAAMRILPEWVGYDEEIKVLQQKVENENRQIEKDEEGSSDDTTKHEEL